MFSGLLPIVEGMANYSFFRQAPIIPEREKNINYQDQYDIYTSDVAKLVAAGFGKTPLADTNFASPRTVDYVLKSSTAGLGTYALDAVDAIGGKKQAS